MSIYEKNPLIYIGSVHDQYTQNVCLTENTVDNERKWLL